jgi:MFS superfamily sulfate permease-like transporter
MEWAGACGDFGTLIPFVTGYIVILKMDPFGILCAFGLAMLACGFYYQTPIPVQPMKAIAAVALTQAASITPTAIYAAALVTGLLWLILGFSGLAARITALVPRPVVSGIVLGLGLSLMLTGVKMMADHWLIAVICLIGTLVSLTKRTFPTMFILLLFGIFCGLILNRELIPQLQASPMVLGLPHLARFDFSWHDLLVGTLFLALPQFPLTLGNAVIAIREENNRLFPERSVDDRKLAISTGAMNIAAAALGGVPMCHGAGGMAGHVTFGARSGGALIILGSLLLFLALFFNDSIHLLLQLFPAAILGVILLISGGQLVLGLHHLLHEKKHLALTLLTAFVALWNVALAFVVGILVYRMTGGGRA